MYTQIDKILKFATVFNIPRRLTVKLKKTSLHYLLLAYFSAWERSDTQALVG
jgi:hypothetical protein